MQPLVILRIVGLLLMIFSSTVIPSLIISWWYDEGETTAFLNAFLVILLSGFLIWIPVKDLRRELRIRDGFIVVVLFWFVFGLVGSLPLYLSQSLDASFTDALFESISALTTTGATVFTGLDDLPRSILYYRQQLQWLGGMGIIVLAVAVLPMLGIGGMQLYRAETPGPIKDNKLTPRITETAKALWYIYLGLTISCALAYWIAGMTPFDALAHSFSTVAIGGFSTHDASIGFFNNRLIEVIAGFFMLLSGINFALHFSSLRMQSLKPYWFDVEFRVYLAILGFASMISVLYLYFTETFLTWSDALHHGIFQTISIGTTAGFTTSDYYNWPGFLPVMLLFISFVGGCAGSTGGGMKVIRFILLFKQGIREIFRLIHPSAQIPVKIGGKVMPENVSNAIWGFFALYVASFSVMMLLLMASGLDQVTAFSALAACLNNLGPGLGDVGANYKGINDFSKWVLCFAMLLGRLEIFTLLVILTPAFWRR
ncbi:TrkH family potassium uptake protein [sulfur-oxidizing endosymbiont of Gigantopelta aegis]|uniref:TrkH family potassium uptake protein n=1 Tax=sulfur-oxidizing endosymbiont of Gigantopelta aegis TaxID=2794934 RepID=UPI0018DC1435|nr:TrkH family potassium uptake protein [sulfur-oxidizing endosymbiont of Gigantopelta aegis]